MRVYDQLFNDINRHIVVVWQCVGVVVGAFAVLALVEKKIVPLDMGISLIVMLSGWLLAHLEDAAYWYNRNLAIISNIERQFLLKSDLTEIHWYFGFQRPDKMLTHLSIQRTLGIGIALLVLIFHFIERVLPGLNLALTAFDPARALPYVVAIASVWWVYSLRQDRRSSYKEFLRLSPGVPVDTTGITPTHGHGRRNKSFFKKFYRGLSK